MLAIRLKHILPHIILENYSAFVHDRMTIDNVMIAHEVCHYMKNRRKRQNGVAALKIDMTKAYDKLEWKFIKDMMEKLGFNTRWVEFVMQCVY